MRYTVVLSLILLMLAGCISSERKEIRRRTPNFVSAESDAPRTAPKRTANPKKKVVTKRPQPKAAPAAAVVAPAKKKDEWVAYPVTQGTMLLLDGGKQTFLPFQEGRVRPDLIRQIMEIDEKHFELFGGFEGRLDGSRVLISSVDTYDQRPVYSWAVANKTRYAVEIPEVARNRFQNEGFKYLALEIVSNKSPDDKFYFHVDPRNIDRPTVIYREDAKVLRVVMGDSEELNATINRNLWINEPPSAGGPQVALPSDTTTRPIQMLHLVRLYFEPQDEEFVDAKYEDASSEEETASRNLVLVGRFTGEGIVTGKFEKGGTAEILKSEGAVQYHFKQEALTVGRGGIKDKPARMEIEFFTLKLGQDEDQLRLALQQAEFKRQQKLNVFFEHNGKRYNEKPDFSFSLKRVDDAAKLALVKRQALKPKQPDGTYTTPDHITSSILELDLLGGQGVIQ